MQYNGSNGTASNSQNLRINNGHVEEDEIDFLRLFNLFLMNKWLIISVIILGGILSYVFIQFQVPKYESRGTIMISQSQNRYSYAGSDLSSLLTTTYGIGVGSTISNELMILKSIKQSHEVAQRILEIEFDENGNKFPILWRDFPNDSTTTEIDVIAGRYRSFVRFERPEPTSEVVEIIFESYSPFEAAEVVNQTINAYSALSTEQNRSMAVSALDFLEEERNRIETELEISEDSLREFMNRTNIIALNPQSEQLISKLANIETQKQNIAVQMVALDANIDLLERQLNDIKPGLSDNYTDALSPIIQRFQFQLAEIETERLMLKIRNPEISPDNSELVRLEKEIEIVKNQIRSLTQQLTDEESYLSLIFASSSSSNITERFIALTSSLNNATIERVQLQTQQDILQEFFVDLNEDFKSLPDEIIALSRLERDVKINEQLYLLVANQFAEMSLWEKTQFGMGRVLDYATPKLNPVSPRKKLIFIVGLLLGGVLSIGIILIRDLVDDKITTTETLKATKHPLLGTIPDFSIMDDFDSTGRQFLDEKSVSNQLITFLDHISPLSEAYRRLRINVVYANPDKHYKVIMVTSATKGEGKSTVAANLAVTFSEAEKSVLIIDLDLRRPTQHKIFGENREPGLTDSLFETVSISNIVRSTVAPNVDLLTVGKKTPEPATVLDSKRLKQLIDRLKDRYDHIILDTAPYGIISDSASLLRLVDGLIVVSRFNVTTKRELEFTLDGLDHLNADILGLVLNAFNPEKSTDYYTNYSYYKRTYYTDYYKEDA